MVAIYSQLLKKRYEGRLDADADEYIGYTVRGALRMEQLVRDLLDYSRVTSDAEDSAALTDANAAYEDALANLQTAITETAAVITCSNLPVVAIGHVHLSLVFQNLIGNALK